MPKKKHKYPRAKTRETKTAKTLSADQLSIVLRIRKISAFIPYLGWLSSAWLLKDAIFNEGKVAEAAGNLFYVCILLALVVMGMSIWLNQLALKEREKPNFNFCRYRNLEATTIAVSIFVNILGVMPFLYGQGYISLWFDSLTNNTMLSVVVAFILGAVVSEILGGAAYDLLKFVIQKTLGFSKEPD